MCSPWYTPAITARVSATLAPKRMALRWAAALALLGACGAAQVHYEIMPPVEYHVALETAGDRPVIVAFLDETLKEHKEELGVFNAAAAEFGCLTTVRTKDDVFKHVNEGGTFVMRTGRARRRRSRRRGRCR